jgi:hypothetical protein
MMTGTVEYPRSYSIRPVSRAFFVLMGASIAAPGLLIFLVILPWNGHAGSPLLFIVSGALIIAGANVVLNAFSKVILYQDALDIRRPFQTVHFNVGELRGFKNYAAKGETTLIFVPKDAAHKSVRLRDLKTDAFFTEWLKKLTDISGDERNAFIQQVLTDISEVDSYLPEMRKSLESAHATAKMTNAVTFVAFVCGLTPGLHTISLYVLMALPWIALSIAAHGHGLYTFTYLRHDIRARLGGSFALPGFALCVGFLPDFHLVSWDAIHLNATALVLLMSATAAYLDRYLVRSWKILGITLFMIPYAYVTLAFADILPDTSAPEIYKARIISKEVTHSNHQAYRLTIAPWGPETDPVDQQVSMQTYNSLSVGDAMCASLHKGYMGAPWYSLDTCKPGMAAK